MGDAIKMNMWFLGVVALWTVSLWLFYLGRHAGLNWFPRTVVTLMPLSVIVFTLFSLNLHRVAFEVMGGLRNGEVSPHDREYGVLFLFTLLSQLAIAPLLICYTVKVVQPRVTGK